MNQITKKDGENLKPVKEEYETEEYVPDEKSEEPKVEIEEEQKEEPKVEVTSKDDLATEYLNLARVIQADFDNYRKRSLEQVQKAKIEGIASAVEVLLPSIDAFKKVKESVKDENTLKGIEMLERAIDAGFEKLGVQKIEALGLPLDPNVHNALAVVAKDGYEDGIIVEEFQVGYKMDGKVIRPSQVLVNKLN